jgi:hypothetical protein
MGWPLLQSWSILNSASLNSVGIGTYSVFVPPGLGGLTVYSQMMDVIPSPLGVAGTSLVKPTLLLN